MIEYDIIAVAPESYDGIRQLNAAANMGWRVVGNYGPHRVILQREVTQPFDEEQAARIRSHFRDVHNGQEQGR
jgi:hypothetical protein